jgi:hypothetical protein
VDAVVGDGHRRDGRREVGLEISGEAGGVVAVGLRRLGDRSGGEREEQRGED